MLSLEGREGIGFIHTYELIGPITTNAWSGAELLREATWLQLRQICYYRGLFLLYKDEVQCQRAAYPEIMSVTVALPWVHKQQCFVRWIQAFSNRTPTLSKGTFLLYQFLQFSSTTNFSCHRLVNYSCQRPILLMTKILAERLFSLLIVMIYDCRTPYVVWYREMPRFLVCWRLTASGILGDLGWEMWFCLML